MATDTEGRRLESPRKGTQGLLEEKVTHFSIYERHALAISSLLRK